jgi:hypothetical protein
MVESETYILVKDTGGISILEKETGLIMKTFNKLKNATPLFMKLTNGHGFDGITPPFFVPTEARKYTARR